jgi:hypothetical protein
MPGPQIQTQSASRFIDKFLGSSGDKMYRPPFSFLLLDQLDDHRPHRGKVVFSANLLVEPAFQGSPSLQQLDEHSKVLQGVAEDQDPEIFPCAIAHKQGPIQIDHQRAPRHIPDVARRIR